MSPSEGCNALVIQLFRRYNLLPSLLDTHVKLDS